MANQLPVVLVVHDDQIVLTLLVEALGRLGYSTIGKLHTMDALQVVEHTPSLQLLLSDMCIESLVDPIVIRRALRVRPDLKVVFMMCGFGDKPFRFTDPVVEKPIALSNLRTAIERALSEPPPPHVTRVDGPERRQIAGLGSSHNAAGA